MNNSSKIYIAGHLGLVGSAIVRKLNMLGYTNIIKRTSSELDLRRQEDVEIYFEEEKPEYVFLAAAKVGGIMANATHQADFIYDNLMIACNVIKAAFLSGVKKILNLGSSCIYPKNAEQPLKETYLLTGLLEPTNEAYAIAKISILKLCRYFNEQYGTNIISVMPSNLYGQNDKFNLETSHVLPAMIRKMHEANLNHNSIIEFWGDGTPRREFLYIDDLSDALIFIMKKYNYADVGEFINIGTGRDIPIKELEILIAKIVGYNGRIYWDKSKPNGTARKLLDVSKINKLGWISKTSLEQGIRKTYEWFKDHFNQL